MTKLVISECFGGFSLSDEAARHLGVDPRDVPRDSPALVALVEQWGTRRVSGPYAQLVVVIIPDGVSWHVHEYDGMETVHEEHRAWGSGGETDCA